MPYFFRLLAPRGRKSLIKEESGMKYNILSPQMWPSWVFGSSQFQIGRDLVRLIAEPDAEVTCQEAHCGWADSRCGWVETCVEPVEQRPVGLISR